MDWVELTTLLAERGEENLIVLDAQQRIVLATRAARRLFGFSRQQMVGRTLAELSLVGQHGAVGRGNPTQHTLAEGCDALGRKLSLALRFEPLGDGASLCTLERVGSGRSFAGRDVDYEIAVDRDRFFGLRSLSYVGGAVPTSELAGRACFEVVCGRDAACCECPAPIVAKQEVGAEYTNVRYVAGGYEIATATHVAPGLLRLRLRHVPGPELRAAQRARVDQLALQAKLSRREREVLEHILLGAPLDEIGACLGISARTVKFHQSNLLAKLGADSRVDLLRVLA
jgi:DNA-binding CsgD family transcriptional regulator